MNLMIAQALTVRSVGKFPVVQVPQTAGKAAAARDALAKAIYGAPRPRLILHDC